MKNNGGQKAEGAWIPRLNQTIRTGVDKLQSLYHAARVNVFGHKKLVMILAALSAVVLIVVATTLLTREEARVAEHGEATHDAHEGEQIVRLHDEELEEFGIAVDTAGPGTLTVQREFPGEITPNYDRLAHVVARVSGVVRKVYKSLGDSVRAGETLAVLDSRDLADAKAAYLAALKRVEIARVNAQREEELWKKKISPQVDYLEAKKAFDEANIELKSAEQKLHALGFSEKNLSVLPSRPDATFTRYKLKAPFTGTVIERHIVLGEAVKEESEVFVVADLGTVWVDISVYPKDLSSIRAGQDVVIKVGDDVPDVTGKIAYVGPVLGETTRTALARMILQNPDRKLLPGMFITAKVAANTVQVPVAVPKTALQSVAGKTAVFVRTAEGFEPRPVEVGRTSETAVEIVSGLEAGEHYVGTGAFTLKAQLSKGAFGDDHDH